MKKVLLILALLCVSLQAQTYQFESASGGSTFYWSLTGQAQKTDSLRVIQGTNMTITQSGNTITFNGAAGAGSTANVRANTGWTSNGTTAQDTLATVYRLDKANVRFIVTDADGDTLWFYPQNLLPFVLKDGSTILAAIDSSGRAGFGTSTSGQARRAILNVLGRAANDTLAIWSNDGGGVVGDSAIFILGNGSLKSGTNYLQISSQFGAQLGNLLLESTFGLSDFATGASIRLVGTTGSIKFFPVGASAQTLIAKTTTKASQGFFTVNAEGTTDTLLVARNDKNSTLDSTMMVFANGDGYFGGNNLYLGGHRIRSNAAGDSLIFYDGSTMIFAILSDGTTADLVATTPFWKFFDKFRNEVLFWILAVAGILACILALLSIYAKVRMLRFGGYETLVENS